SILRELVREVLRSHHGYRVDPVGDDWAREILQVRDERAPLRIGPGDFEVAGVARPRAPIQGRDLERREAILIADGFHRVRGALHVCPRRAGPDLHARYGLRRVHQVTMTRVMLTVAVSAICPTGRLPTHEKF